MNLDKQLVVVDKQWLEFILAKRISGGVTFKEREQNIFPLWIFIHSPQTKSCDGVILYNEENKIRQSITVTPIPQTPIVPYT